MPRSRQAALLNDTYRAAQGRAATDGALQALTIMRETLDPAALDATFPAYLAAAFPGVQAAHSGARLLGAAYYQTFRLMEAAEGDPTTILSDPLAVQQVLSSLLTTGPVAMKVAMRGGATLERAVAVAESLTGGAVFRLIANGARHTIADSLAADPQAQRWQRVTDGKPCKFCEMLAGRGAVYITNDTAVGRDFHDKCGCHAEAVYD